MNKRTVIIGILLVCIIITIIVMAWQTDEKYFYSIISSKAHLNSQLQKLIEPQIITNEFELINELTILRISQIKIIN